MKKLFLRTTLIVSIISTLLITGLFINFSNPAPAAPETPVEDDQQNFISTLSFGVFPYLTPILIEEFWGPISIAVSNNLGAELMLGTSSSFSSYTNNLNLEIYDVALIQPFDYVQLDDPNAYIPVARFSEPLTGVFVVTADSPIKEISDLRNKIIGTPPTTAAVSILGEITLRRATIRKGTYAELVTFDAYDTCIQALFTSRIDMCVTNIIPVRNFESQNGVKLTIIGETIAIPHVLVAVHRRVPVNERLLIQKTFLDLSQSPEGQVLLTKAGLIHFMEAQDEDYDIVREFVEDMGK